MQSERRNCNTSWCCEDDVIIERTDCKRICVDGVGGELLALYQIPSLEGWGLIPLGISGNGDCAFFVEINFVDVRGKEVVNQLSSLNLPNFKALVAC